MPRARVLVAIVVASTLIGLPGAGHAVNAGRLNERAAVEERYPDITVISNPGAIGLSTWATAASYDDVVVSTPDGGPGP
jgi:hypothetical protein